MPNPSLNTVESLVIHNNPCKHSSKLQLSIQFTPSSCLDVRQDWHDTFFAPPCSISQLSNSMFPIYIQFSHLLRMLMGAFHFLTLQAKLRVYNSKWTQSFCLDTVGSTGLVICYDRERNRKYQVWNYFLWILSELSLWRQLFSTLYSVPNRNRGSFNFLDFFQGFSNFCIPVSSQDWNVEVEPNQDRDHSSILPRSERYGVQSTIYGR